MKSYFVELTGIGRSRISQEDIDAAKLQEDEVLVQAEYSLISAGTELSRAFGLKQGFSYPVRPGYSLTGTVIAAGRKAEVKNGDRVFVNTPHASLVKTRSGDRVQGPIVLKLDDDIDLLEATAINLGLVAMQGVNLSEVKPGYRAGVFGLGNIGIITALLYRKLGCKVIGLDIVKERCELALNMGLQNVSWEKDQKQVINDFTQGQGLDIAVDATGLASVIMSAVDCTRAYGQTILLGSPRVACECDVTPLLSNIHMKDLKVIGAFNATVPVEAKDGSNASMKNNFRVLMEMMRERDVDFSRLISKTVEPEECERAYYELMYQPDKVNGIAFDWRKYHQQSL